MMYSLVRLVVDSNRAPNLLVVNILKCWRLGSHGAQRLGWGEYMNIIDLFSGISRREKK